MKKQKNPIEEIGLPVSWVETEEIPLTVDETKEEEVLIIASQSEVKKESIEKINDVIHGQLRKIDLPIHTVLIIKDGSLDIGDIKIREDKNYFYRVNSRIDGFALIDFDKTNMVPITKDILNRQHTFIEIKYLKFILIISFLILIGMIVVWFVVPKEIPTFDTAKTEILTEIRKQQQLKAMEAQPVQKIPSQTISSPTTTIDTGYTPIFPETTSKNTRKNIPTYAD